MKSNYLPTVECVELLDIKVDLLTEQQLIGIAETAINTDRKIIISHHNLHSIYLFHHTPIMKYFYGISDYIFIDGMSIIAIANLLKKKKISRDCRITSVDWILPFFIRSLNSNWKIFYLGSKKEVIESGVQVWKKQYPGLQIDCAHGYFDHERNSFENRQTIERINDYQPDILFVGMGMPLQERWIFENHTDLNTHVIFPIGALVDYYANAISTPPRLFSKYGFEWLFRLLDEPKRLWKRYLVEPWFILELMLREINRDQHPL